MEVPLRAIRDFNFNFNFLTLSICMFVKTIYLELIYTFQLLSRPRYYRERGIVFDRFSIYLFLCMFVYSFLCQQDYEKTAGPICMKFNFQGRCGVTTGQPDYILVNSEKPRDAAMRNTGAEFAVLWHHSLFAIVFKSRHNR